MCVGSVFTQPPYNDSFFLILLKHFPFLISSHSQMRFSIRGHVTQTQALPRLLIDKAVLP